MKEENVAEVVKELSLLIRKKWDKLGFVEGDGGAFATGHTPAKAPLAYLCRFYPSLSAAELDEAEVESERFLPKPYREFLKSFNGANIMGISLHGATGGQNLRDLGNIIGQPVSVRYQNAYSLRPDYIPEGHFGLGAMNGEWFSQGHLYLTSTGEVELFNAAYDLVGNKWPSFSNFLRTEIPRQMTRYNEAGKEIVNIKRLPGNTDDWERLAKEKKEQEKAARGLAGRVRRFFCYK